MIVAHILNQKGREVATVEPGQPVSDVVSVLGTRSYGALVVSGSDRRIQGIISERDVVKLLARSGAGALSEPVSKHMTAKVVTCAADDTIDQVMQAMTKGRFRHMPVEHDGKLNGIISIGDVVKARLEQLANESEALRAYING
ncbi:MAG TPA: CBS domain-containing protein [Beijerinckiaceae bacterium]|nr:CBS domain-containing protein [Beijerinckiaceae bacterium]